VSSLTEAHGLSLQARNGLVTDMQGVENSTQSPEMDRFRAALKDVLTVSKKELDRRLAKEKPAKADRPRKGYQD